MQTRGTPPVIILPITGGFVAIRDDPDQTRIQLTASNRTTLLQAVVLNARELEALIYDLRYELYRIQNPQPQGQEGTHEHGRSARSILSQSRRTTQKKATTRTKA